MQGQEALRPLLPLIYDIFHANSQLLPAWCIGAGDVGLRTGGGVGKADRSRVPQRHEGCFGFGVQRRCSFEFSTNLL